jgi:predicted metalloprotease
VRVELQADCYAGVWGHHRGEQETAIRATSRRRSTAATAIGDDRCRSRLRAVVPESFTHGSSAQRVRWFSRGMETGRSQTAIRFRRLGLVTSYANVVWPESQRRGKSKKGA